MTSETPAEADGGRTGIQRLLNVHWSHVWTDLPPEVEREVEIAFEHVVNARDMLEEIDE